MEERAEVGRWRGGGNILYRRNKSTHKEARRKQEGRRAGNAGAGEDQENGAVT